MELKGKKVVVTGSSSGIGQAIAIAFAEKGAVVAITYHAHKAGAEKTLAVVKEHSDGFVYGVDITKPEEVTALFAAIEKDMGVPDVLVNCAGDAQAGDLYNNEEWKFQHENIFMSAVRACQEFLSRKSASPRKIITITSLYGGLQTGNPEYLQYSVAKAALNSLTTNLAKTYAPQVLVNAVAPGYTWTPAWEGISDTEKKRYEQATDIGRFVTAEEIARAVLFLAENDAMTGQIITVDGGTSLTRLNTHD